jgi:hypothetical protein
MEYIAAAIVISVISICTLAWFIKKNECKHDYQVSEKMSYTLSKRNGDAIDCFVYVCRCSKCGKMANHTVDPRELLCK